MLVSGANQRAELQSWLALAPLLEQGDYIPKNYAV